MSRKVILSFILIVMLSGCAKPGLTDKEIGMITAQSTDFVHGASSMSYISVSEAGVFYIEDTGDGHLLSYYDYDADTHFALCNAPECTHMDEECAAFFSLKSSIDGFAYYHDALYLLEKGLEDREYQLIQMSVNCENRTVLATVPAEGEWSVAAIRDVYYCGGYAWIHAAYDRYDEGIGDFVVGEKLLAISLSDGAVISLTDMLTAADHNLAYLAFQAISDSWVAWKIECYDKPLLSMDTFYEQNGTVDGYEDYVTQYYETTAMKTDFWAISLKDMKPVQIPYPGDIIVDFYQGGCLGLIIEGDVETVVRYDLETGEMEKLCSIQDGGSLARYQGEVFNALYEGEKLLFMERQPDGNAQVSSYSMADGSITQLFQDVSTISFRIVGETKDRLIGNVVPSTDYVWIWKEDYRKGNWSDGVPILSRS